MIIKRKLTHPPSHLIVKEENANSEEGTHIFLSVFEADGFQLHAY